ncbi:hypothetical protein CMK10_02590 [Candidatus Poribacteria bacterium]|nr:hypothetical protein [Candidatus Poribacteria bacterium]
MEFNHKNLNNISQIPNVRKRTSVKQRIKIPENHCYQVNEKTKCKSDNMAIDYSRDIVELATRIFLNTDPDTNDSIANIHCRADNTFASVNQHSHQAPSP